MPNEPEYIASLREKMAELKKSDPEKYLALLKSLNSMLTETVDEIDSLLKKHQEN